MKKYDLQYSMNMIKFCVKSYLCYVIPYSKLCSCKLTYHCKIVVCTGYCCIYVIIEMKLSANGNGSVLAVFVLSSALKKICF